MTRGRVNNKNLLQFYKGLFKTLNVEQNPNSWFITWLESKNPRGFEGWKLHVQLKEKAFRQLMEEQDNE